MRLLHLLAFLTLTINCVYSQSNQMYIVTGKVFDDLKALLPNGTTKAEIMDGVKASQRYLDLQNKFMIGVRQHQEWFLEQQKIAEKTGKPVGYHPNLGMTEAEFNELKSLMESGTGIELVSSGTESLTIKWGGDSIEFEGTGRLNAYNKLLLIPKENIAIIGDYKLDKFDLVNVESENNAFKSKWKGYSWRYEFSNKGEGFNQIENMNDLQTLNMKIYKITVGQIAKDLKTYLQITESEITNGVKTKNIELPIIF
jgi:hypothetical protein